MTEFELKFAEETKNKYKGALRYVSSEYEKNKDELKIKFIYDSRFSYINEDEKSINAVGFLRLVPCCKSSENRQGQFCDQGKCNTQRL